MKKQSFNFKDLKGTLTRDEMRALKGGDGPITCYSCRGLTPAVCYQTYCANCGPGGVPYFCNYDGTTNEVCVQCTPS